MAKIKVKVRERVGKRGQFPLLYKRQTLWVIPNSIIEVDEDWLAENGQYFIRLDGTEDVVLTDNDKKVIEELKTVMGKEHSKMIEREVKNLRKQENELSKKEKHVPKNSGLAEFLELKKKVVALGVNTNGLKREDLEKILKEHEGK
jgi:hypothetical protein